VTDQFTHGAVELTRACVRSLDASGWRTRRKAAQALMVLAQAIPHALSEERTKVITALMVR
jgi:hypothetical protein